MLKVVLDTNVLISGIIVSAGPSAQILDEMQAGEIQLITSAPLLQEFIEVVLRPHIANKYPGVAAHADALLDFLRANAVLVVGAPEHEIVVEDPDDDFVLACALEGKADFIVSGDPHLLALNQIGETPIVSPRQFIERISSL